MTEETTGGLEGQVRDLAGLIEYQEGAVVSRRILKNEGGDVTLFAFDAGQGLSEHTTPFDALVIVLDGGVEISIAGSPSAVHSGEMIIMPAGKPHALRALARFKMLLVMLKS